MGARVVEGTGLENRRRLIPVRGFESHLIRFFTFTAIWVNGVMLRRHFLKVLGFTGFSAMFGGRLQADSDFYRTVHRVAVSRVSWTSDYPRFQISAVVYYPSDPVELSPVVIYSHGLGGSPDRFAYLGNMWASRGIISIFIHHPETDESQWRGHLRAVSELESLYKRYWSARDRALAIRFVIDRLTEKGIESSSFAPIMDTSRIGVAGNDLGSLAAALVAGQLPPDNGDSLADSRVSAVAMLSPTVYCDAAHAPVVYGGISAPFLSIAGTKDDGIIGPTRAEQRRIPFDALFRQDRYHATLEKGDHLVYSGHLRVSKRESDRLYQDAIRSVTTLFWSAYLQTDPDALQILQMGDRVVFSKLMSIEFRKGIESMRKI